MKSTPDNELEIKRKVFPPSGITQHGIDNTQGKQKPIKRKVAVFVTHGMGQQVPFETIDTVTEGLTNAAKRHERPVNDIRLRAVQIGETRTQRAEFDMRNANKEEVEVHIYEGYWAPITEGQVSLRDVTSFLISAGFKGLRNSGLLNNKPFKRWIFNNPVSFGTQRLAAFQLLLTLGILLGLIVLNAVIAAVAGYKFFAVSPTPGFTDSTFDALTSIVGTYVVGCLVFAVPLGLLLFLSKWKSQPNVKKLWYVSTWAVHWLFRVWALLTIVSGALLLTLIILNLRPDILICPWMSKYWFVIWGLLLLVSWYVRKIYVEFLGDVAAYVDSHSLDRFNEIRTKIKSRVFEQAKAVYSNPEYDSIAMVGHSLGSAITYDTLNALLNHDSLTGGKLGVNERTKLLLTFGSPLDKLAFIFASQINNATATREALAATLQPLIQKYAPFRNIKWVNVYAPRDIISGKLEFYDDKNADGYDDNRTVDNVIDHDAMVPLAAHIEYWNNTTVFDQLYAHL